jgi:hypothetical protein
VAARTTLRYGDGERLAAREPELLGDQVMFFGKRPRLVTSAPNAESFLESKRIARRKSICPMARSSPAAS